MICERCGKEAVDGRGGCEGAQHGNIGCAMNCPPLIESHFPAMREKECPECFGKGKRNLSDGSWMKCDYCGGRGTVTADEVQK